MKKILLIALLALTCTAFSQNKIQKNLGDFKQLKVYDLIEVELIKANQNKMLITGNNSDNVVINNKNGTLKIKLRLEEAYKGKGTKVTLYYKNLDIIDANEGAYIYSKDKITQYSIDLKTQEGAKIETSLNVKYLNIKATSGGVITASGIAQHQEATVFTGGIYKVKLLDTKVTNVSINAAGEAYITVKNKVTAKVRVGGNIYIYGNPVEVDQNKIIGGQIKIME